MTNNRDKYSLPEIDCSNEAEYASLIADKVPESSEIDIHGYSIIDLKWLDRITKLEKVTISSSITDLEGFPKLPRLKSLVVASTDFSSLKGIEKFENLETLEFSVLKSLKTLQPLSGLTTLNEFIGPRIRRNFPDSDSCPENAEAPAGLRKYCWALDILDELPIGPLPL